MTSSFSFAVRNLAMIVISNSCKDGKRGDSWAIGGSERDAIMMELP